MVPKAPHGTERVTEIPWLWYPECLPLSVRSEMNNLASDKFRWTRSPCSSWDALLWKQQYDVLCKCETCWPFDFATVMSRQQPFKYLKVHKTGGDKKRFFSKTFLRQHSKTKWQCKWIVYRFQYETKYRHHLVIYQITQNHESSKSIKYISR